MVYFIVVKLGAVKLDNATCIYKSSLYTVWGCIYKLGKFVMANSNVAGIYSDIFSNGIYSDIPYIFRYIKIYSQKYKIYSDIYILAGIYSEIYIISEIFRYI